ncbi:hypothetical protein H4R23_006373, partial [Coemansia sp. Cherry 401B]
MNTMKITFGIAALASAVFAQGYSAVAPTDVYSSTAPAYQAVSIPSDYVESPSSVEDYTTSSEEQPAYSAIPP